MVPRMVPRFSHVSTFERSLSVCGTSNRNVWWWAVKERIRAADPDSFVDDAETVLVDASLRELLAFRGGLAGKPSLRGQLESRVDLFKVKDRRFDRLG